MGCELVASFISYTSFIFIHISFPQKNKETESIFGSNQYLVQKRHSNRHSHYCLGLTLEGQSLLRDLEFGQDPLTCFCDFGIKGEPNEPCSIVAPAITYSCNLGLLTLESKNKDNSFREGVLSWGSQRTWFI